MRILPVLFVLPLLAGGCVVKTAANIVTLPVKAGAKAVDWTTTSQDEADRNRGREMRKREKECRKHPERCQNDPH
jgi:hypothetical protein